jgi:hypothetical protein
MAPRPASAGPHRWPGWPAGHRCSRQRAAAPAAAPSNRCGRGVPLLRRPRKRRPRRRCEDAGADPPAASGRRELAPGRPPMAGSPARWRAPPGPPERHPCTSPRPVAAGSAPAARQPAGARETRLSWGRLRLTRRCRPPCRIRGSARRRLAGCGQPRISGSRTWPEPARILPRRAWVPGTAKCDEPPGGGGPSRRARVAAYFIESNTFSSAALLLHFSMSGTILPIEAIMRPW